MDTLKFLLKEQEIKIKSCPFCNEKEPALWELAGVYWVQCGNCNAATSMEDDRMSALGKWNRRPE